MWRFVLEVEHVAKIPNRVPIMVDATMRASKRRLTTACQRRKIVTQIRVCCPSFA